MDRKLSQPYMLDNMSVLAKNEAIKKDMTERNDRKVKLKCDNREAPKTVPTAFFISSKLFDILGWADNK